MDAGDNRIGCVQLVELPNAMQTFPISPASVPPGQDFVEIGCDDLQNYRIAADLPIDRSGRQARIASKVQRARDGRITGSDVVTLGEGSSHREILIPQGGIQRAVKAALNRARQRWHR